MQVANVKQVAKPNLANKAINQTLIQQSEVTKVKVDNVVELNKTQSFNRLLEAYGDCV